MVCLCKKRKKKEKEYHLLPFLREITNLLETQENSNSSINKLSDILLQWTYEYCKTQNNFAVEKFRKYIEVVEKIIEIKSL